MEDIKDKLEQISVSEVKVTDRGLKSIAWSLFAVARAIEHLAENVYTIRRD